MSHIQSEYTVALAGNPNVGKSTVFNALTGMHQHTGNWSGKTVSVAKGVYTYHQARYVLTDLPGTYSLSSASPEEEVARDFLTDGAYEAVVVVADATCLERNLNLTLQILSVTSRVVLCVNLLDEAKKKNIFVDLDTLSKELGIPVVGASARGGVGLNALKDAVALMCSSPEPAQKFPPMSSEETVKTAETIAKVCVSFAPSKRRTLDRKIDRFLTSKYTGIPVMLGLLGVVLWITIVGANYPSSYLMRLFQALEPTLFQALTALGLPPSVVLALSAGMFRTLGWVIAVMLPPMAIFFPLFTLLEDVGYLPRIAFNLDRVFCRAGAHGKQALTMCMGFGCNACGVTGCRIIDSPRERLIAILTNVFVPCNGRFPTLIALITMFFAGQIVSPMQTVVSALLLTLTILLGIGITFLVSRLLSSTLLRGVSSSFVLELPPYRRPQVGKVLVRSVFDRTLFVLGRAVVVSAPAGLLLWVLSNVNANGVSLLSHLTGFFEPFGRAIGLDGVILTGFLLGFPANEIVLPIIMMCYLSTGSLAEYESLSALRTILTQNGWTTLTALNTILFSLCHFPCATTCQTIRKETGSWRWTLVSFLLPTAVGILLCILTTTLARLFG
ncbi:MAG: ferrous iron transporter B [Oscillospiraceae bacterium]|nr:ferrous iron transporter B [Oscillospiraceae bacterium]